MQIFIFCEFENILSKRANEVKFRGLLLFFIEKISKMYISTRVLTYLCKKFKINFSFVTSSTVHSSTADLPSVNPGTI